MSPHHIEARRVQAGLTLDNDVYIKHHTVTANAADKNLRPIGPAGRTLLLRIWCILN